MALYIGLDLGGTNIKSAVLDETGRLLAAASVPTGAEEGPEVVIAALVQAAHDVAAQAGVGLGRIDAIGIGSPGPMDFDAGVVINAPNLSNFVNVPLRDRIAAGTGRPTVLENDANAAVLGEYWAGAARDPQIRHVVMLTLGTGIGAGLVDDGKIVHGAFGNGGEGGHIIVVPDGRACACGQRGCLEAYASASWTARRAEEALDAWSGGESGGGGQASLLAQLYQPGQQPLTAKAVFDAAMAGDALALQIVDETATYLGLACVSFCRLLDPQMILFAGGMILSGDFLFHRVRQAFAKHTWTVAADRVRITPAALGNDAGVIGAGAVAWDAHQGGRLG